MARRKGVNKSAEIRRLLEADPKMKARAVIDALAAKGLRVSPAAVYFVKSMLNRKKRKQRRWDAVETSRRAGVADPVDLVVKVRQLAVQAGGLSKLKELVEVLVG